MDSIRWGIVGCGDVTEIKSGPGFSKAENSSLVSVMRRNADLARDYAQRHGVAKWTDDAAQLIHDDEVDAVYVATPPRSHKEIVLMCAAAGKPVLVEKPIAMDEAEALEMIEACKGANVPLFVAYYRRALPIYLKVKEIIDSGLIGEARTVHISHFERAPEPGFDADGIPWRMRPEVGGGGIFVDIGCHAFDLMDFIFGPVVSVSGFAANLTGLYPAEDTVSASFVCEGGVHGVGEWCFTTSRDFEETRVVGTHGEVSFSIFTPNPVVVSTPDGKTEFDVGYPKHVHQPLIQTVVDDLLGKGVCASTGETGMRATKVIDAVLQDYRAGSAETG
ncbi:MAG: Gfo/Idh/MocA family oxidoreductase [Rhodospirillales bacterium]|jgi:predicted dehydrogenase|nr:Gfo/Idh/MocA family oxidoreductase [Rhodospirillales bacterium]